VLKMVRNQYVKKEKISKICIVCRKRFPAVNPTTQVTCREKCKDIYLPVRDRVYSKYRKKLQNSIEIEKITESLDILEENGKVDVVVFKKRLGIKVV